jgi:DNA end-binding protein Ku
VGLYNARHDRSNIRFNLINPETGNRIRMITQDAETGDEVQRRDLVKGYEFKKNQYVLLTAEDFDSVKVESSSVMTVEKFVDTGSIDPMYYDASYFVAPDGKAGIDVYAVLREAIAKTGKTGLARVVISQRERTIALRPRGEGLIAHTLHEDRDLNSPKELFDELSGVKVDPEMVQLASQLIQRQAGKYDPGDLEDHYETRLRAMIDAKLKGEGIDLEADVTPPRGTNVVDLMTVLKQSLGQTPGQDVAKQPQKKLAKPPAPRAAAAQAATGRSRKRA